MTRQTKQHQQTRRKILIYVGENNAPTSEDRQQFINVKQAPAATKTAPMNLYWMRTHLLSALSLVISIDDLALSRIARLGAMRQYAP